MSSLRYIFSAGAAILLLWSCSISSGRGAEQDRYFIHGESLSVQDVRAGEYMRWHLIKRVKRKGIVSLSPSGATDVTLHVGEDVGADYSVTYTPEGYRLAARNERTMIWLTYQFLKHIGSTADEISVEDLPPSIFPQRDTIANFPFEYRDIYMPSNQNEDMTYILGLNNLEIDWGIWGHNLSMVLGTNGDSFYGYQYMDAELFARNSGSFYKQQFCFSSGKLYDLTEKYILTQWGDGSKDGMRITIGPNDNGIVCDCRLCTEAGNTNGNCTPALAAFITKLANRFPGHQFFIPAYSVSARPPKNPLPENVGVFISAIDYPRAFSGRGGEAFFSRLEAWQKVSRKIYVWDYVCNFDDYLSPYPILYVMQRRIQEYVKRGIKGIFLNGSGYFYSTQQEAYSFVLSSLLANPYVNIDDLMREYYADAMPGIGHFFAMVNMAMERRAASSGTELPLYGGIEEALESYLFEDKFRMFYRELMPLDSVSMTHRERVIYEKTRQSVAFSFLEMSRLHGLDSLGFLSPDGSVKTEILQALEYLRYMTPEDDIYLLTDNENSSMDHMDRVNENGIYLADYESEVSRWLSARRWEENCILGKPLKVKTLAGSMVSSKLTDGVEGLSQNYQWGWQIYPQAGFTVELPSADMASAREISLSFLNLERHRMSPPRKVELWAGGEKLAELVRDGLEEYIDEGEKVVFSAALSLPPHVSNVELRVVPSHSRDLAIDEIVVRR